MGLSVLIVDDEPDILSGMRRILRRDGYTVHTAISIEEATDRENWADYFAVLLDRKLPDGMSDEFVPMLKKLAPQAAIIVITAYADLESSLASLRNGVEDYLLKPVEPEAVLHRLNRVHEMRRAEQRAHQAERLSAIGEMMTAIAHESRNALQRMQAGIDILSLDLPEHSEARENLDRIDRAERLATVVRGTSQLRGSDPSGDVDETAIRHLAKGMVESGSRPYRPGRGTCRRKPMESI